MTHDTHSEDPLSERDIDNYCLGKNAAEPSFLLQSYITAETVLG